ncbi:hypothetical protein KP509_09G012600 [Ceratopteris richardii]|uniref:Cryptochrome 5 n=1 Tax=Ceratopteris richardii TaxID=49495 RepID=A0A6M6CCK3_CERRI|nr:hypothetical protein KP509_09G012600 [Ceratopteris richardii]QJX57317.1 cryptochrome 5 [Ceratopteris richardii]
MACSTIVWFRRDLRVNDNPALKEASKNGGQVVPVFIWAPEEEGQFQLGRMSRWWLKQSLVHLAQSLQSLGTRLIVRRSSSSFNALLELILQCRASQVFFNHLYDPISLVRDHRVKEGLLQAGVHVRTFNADLLYEPWEVNDLSGKPFTLFNDFWDRCLNMPDEPLAPLLPPTRLLGPKGYLPSCDLEDLELEKNTEKDSNALLNRSWRPGWDNAEKSLEAFLDGYLLQYAASQHKVDGSTTSFLSPHLHFGELSVRKIFYSLRQKSIQWKREGVTDGELSINLFMRSIGLREYSRYICFNFPLIHERLMIQSPRPFPWRVDESLFKVWRQGRTGYPLVDAGMRQIWATGWLHNRIRVVVSSFFVKFLHLPWTWGMKYFWDALLDADLENDILGWQYISGGLPDGHEHWRIDDPQVEGYKYDPEGEYVRKWLPELSRLPTEWIHHPWNAPPGTLRAAGVELGCNYPRPLVEFVAARSRLEMALQGS